MTSGRAEFTHAGLVTSTAPVEVDPARICELLVRLPDVNMLGVIDEPGGVVRVVIETRGVQPACGEFRAPTARNYIRTST